jgi:hypothetical protein
MSLHAFDTLRSSHPGETKQIDLLEQAFVSMLQDDPDAVVDDRYLNQTLHLDKPLLRQLLVSLVAKGFLAVRVFWMCPNGYGTAREADHVRELPSVIVCSRCGEEHWLSEADIDLRFVATDRLIEELRRAAR